MARAEFRRGLKLPELDLAASMDALPDGPDTDILGFIREKTRLVPRKDEAQWLLKVERAADAVVDDLFADADLAMAELRYQARIPEMVGGVPKQENGKLVWATDEKGEYFLDWKRVDGMDVEATIMRLQEAIDRGVDEVGKLHGRAVFAYNISQDEYWNAYRNTVGGTVNDNTAAAHRASKDSRYYWIAMLNIWQRADRKLEAVKNAMRGLEFLRSRLIKEADPPGWRR
jgi:hypothetical protein